jgi:NADH:ubiquinone oxidoreductase subunit C
LDWPKGCRVQDASGAEGERQTVVVCRNAAFLATSKKLKDLGASLQDICAVQGEGNEIELSYFFKKEGNLFIVRTVTAGRVINSLFSLYKSADFIEREISRLFGVKFMGHPRLYLAGA